MAATEIRAGRAFVELLAKDTTLTSGLIRAQAQLRNFARLTDQIGEQLTAIGKKFLTLGLAAVGGLTALAKIFANVGSELLDMNSRTGMSVEALSELRYAAEQTGAAAEDVETGIRKMQKAIVSAAEGNKSAIQTLQTLGLTLDDLKGKTPDQLFLLISKGLAAIHDPTVKAGLAIELFGKSGTKLIPLIDQADRLQKRFEELGLTITTDQAKDAHELADIWEDIKFVFERVAIAVGSALKPALMDIGGQIIKVAVAGAKWVDSHKEIIVTALAVAGGVAAAGAMLIAAGLAFKVLGFAALGLSPMLGIVKAGIGGISMAFGLLKGGLGIVGSLLGGVVPVFASIGRAALLVLNPFKLIPALMSMTSTAIAAVAGVFGSIFGVIAAVLSPVVLIGVAVVGLAAYLLYTSGIAGRAFAAIQGYAGQASAAVSSKFLQIWAILKSGWETVRADAMKAFGGIKDAISAGDWATAAAILWTTIKLEFNRGMKNLWDPLVSAFYTTKFALLDGWQSTVDGIKYIWSYAKEYLSSWDGVKNAAQKFLLWLVNVWAAATDSLTTAIGDKLAESRVVAQAEGEVMARHRDDKNLGTPEGEAAFNKEKDALVAQRLAELQDQISRRPLGADAQKRVDDYMSRQKALDDAFKAQQPNAVAAGEDERARIAAARAIEQAKREKELRDALANIDPSRQAEIDKLEKQLNQLVTEAAKAKKDAEDAADAHQEPIRKVDSQQDDYSKIPDNSPAKSLGAFNPFAIQAFQTGPLVDFAKQTAKNTADTARNTKNGPKFK